MASSWLNQVEADLNRKNKKYMATSQGAVHFLLAAAGKKRQGTSRVKGGIAAGNFPLCMKIIPCQFHADHGLMVGLKVEISIENGFTLRLRCKEPLAGAPVRKRKPGTGNRTEAVL